MGLLTIAPIKHLNYRLRYTLNNMLMYHFGYTLACRICCTLGYRLRYKLGNRVEYKTAYRLKRIPDKMPQDKMPQIRHGQNATGQNATKRKPDKMLQNKNASKL